MGHSRPAFAAETILARIEGARADAKYQRDQLIYCEGDPAPCVYYLRSGKVAVITTSPEGKEAVIAILPAGSFCGEECLNGHALRMTTLRGLTDCVLIRMPKTSTMRALRDDPAFCRLFTTYLLERNIRVQEDLADQLLNSTERRLARLLLILANHGQDESPASVIPRINQKRSPRRSAPAAPTSISS
jgi:CRP-like cAMP-binding protein